MKRNNIQTIKIILAGLIFISTFTGCNFGNLENKNKHTKAHILFNDVSRYIAPADVTDSEIKKTVFLYKQSNSTDEFEELKSWQAANASENAIDLMLAERNLYMNPGTYSFKLDLYIKKGNSYEICQSGIISNKTIVGGDNILSFDAEYSQDGTGDLSIIFDWSIAAQNSNFELEQIKVSLYSLNPDDLTTSNTEAYSATVYDFSEDGNITQTPYNQSAIPAGYYTMLVKLYDENDLLLKTFDDVVHIVSGCSSNATWTLSDINLRYILTYIVNINAYWNNRSKTEKYNPYASITLPTAEQLTLEGYTLVKWTNEDGSIEYNPGQQINSISDNTSLFARWKKCHKITLIDGDHRSVVYSDDEATISEPTVSVPDGKTLLGWYSEDGAFDFSTPITKSMTIRTIFFAGDGSEANPYLLENIDDWNSLAALDSASTQGKYFKLNANIGSAEAPVTTMVGTELTTHEFCGIFDGNSKTLTINYNTDLQYAAPFRYINGATIKNLYITGKNTNNYKTTGNGAYSYTAGLVGHSAGNSSVNNCSNSVEILSMHSGESHNGGFAGYGYPTITNCIFTGKLLGTTSSYNRGFNGYGGTVKNCIFAPQEITMNVSNNSQTFGTSNSSYSYYTTAFGSLQGSKADIYTNTSQIQNQFYQTITILGTAYYVVPDVSVTNLSSYYTTTNPSLSSFAVKTGSNTLTKNTDYTYSIQDSAGNTVQNLNASGEYTFIIQGMGSFTGTTTVKTYVITDTTLSGSGTTSDPYLINNISDWYKFAKNVKNGTTYSGQYIKLASDIGTSNNPVTGKDAMIGTDFESHFGISTNRYAFEGIFDGNGKTLLINFNESTDYLSPFKYIKNATIKNLIISGKINNTYSNYHYSSGLVSYAEGNCTIENCLNKVELYSDCSDCYLNAFIYKCRGALIVKNCIYTGKIIGNHVNYFTGFCYYIESPSSSRGSGTFENCIFAPQEISIRGSNMKTITNSSGNTINISSCYYTKTLGTAQGTQADIYTSLSEIQNQFYRTVTIMGTTYYIVPKCISIEGISNYYVTGNSSLSINPVVKFGTFTLTENSDYTYSIKNSNGITVQSPEESGEYTLVIQGTGIYTGTKPIGFSLVDSISLSGNGTAEEPYLINNLADWYKFAENVRNGTTYYRQYIKLTADIGTTSNPITGATGMIGTDNNQHVFSGTFDGNGKTLTIDFNTNLEYAAPFRYINNATIKNLIVTGKNTSSNNYAAGLAGYASNSCTIEDCTNSVDINCTGQYGSSFVGYSYGNIKIENCIFLGRLLATQRSSSGGFIGYNYTSYNNNNIIITNCLYAPQDTTTIKNKISRTFVTYSSATLTSCYYTETANTIQGLQAFWNLSDIPVEDEYLYTRKSFANANNSVELYIPVELELQGLKERYNKNGSSINVIEAVKTGDIELEQNADYSLQIKDSHGDNIQTVTDTGIYTLIITGSGDYHGTVKKTFNVINNFKGSGTQRDPFLITDVFDLELLANRVSLDETFEGMYFKMMYSIGTTEDPVKFMIGAYTSDNYTPNDHAFKGIFDGNGKTITISYNSDLQYAAPFCYIDGATIKNLTVTGPNLNNKTTNNVYAAGLTGYTKGNCTIDNCVSNVEINSACSGSSYCGGFAGYVGNIITIKNSVFTGKMIGQNATNNAGFIGYRNSSYYSNNLYTNLENCLFAPSEISMDSEYFNPFIFCYNTDYDLEQLNVRFSSCYYLSAFGNSQGEQVYSTETNIPSSNRNYYKQQVLADGNSYYIPYLKGEGTEDNPYLITSRFEWDLFSRTVGDIKYENTFIKLTTDIGNNDNPVTKMIGTYYRYNCFTGVFDGDGHTLTIDYNFEIPNYVAPFHYLKDSTIKNLKVTGRIITNYRGYNFSGLAGGANGSCTIENCISSVEIDAGDWDPDDNYVFTAGFVGYNDGNLTIKNCIFNGKLLGEYIEGNAGFVGRNASIANLENCIFAPQEITMKENNSCTFVNCNYDDRNNKYVISECYYLTQFGKAQGLKAYTSINDIPASNRNSYKSKVLTDGNTYYIPYLKGEGTEDNPYTIGSNIEWDVFAELVTDGNSFENKYIQLTANIGNSENPVTTMAGSFKENDNFDYTISFKGIFDGNGKILTVNYNKEYEYVSPFPAVKSAIIKNLTVSGNITSNYISAAGLISYIIPSNGYYSEDTCTIENCIINATINSTFDDSSYAYNGGFVGFCYENLILNNCKFTGKLLGPNAKENAGFVASGYNTILTNCLFAPQEITMSEAYSSTFASSEYLELNSCYYTTPFGTVQGELYTE